MARFNAYNHAIRTENLRLEREYLLAPNQCQRCQVALSYKQRLNKFCSKSCATIINNALRTFESRAKQQQSINQTYLERNPDADQKRRAYYQYLRKCAFKFEDYSQIEGYELIEKLGWFSTAQNPAGVARDHMLSIRDGYYAGVDPAIISHPANCRIIPQSENRRKGKASCLTLDELMVRIRGSAWIRT